MKKTIALFALALGGLFVSSIPALAGSISTPHLAGDFQTPTAWDPGANPMTLLGGDIWTSTITGLVPGSRHEFKITDGTWDNNLPGANSWFYADGSGEITITYDGTTYDDGMSPATDRLGLSTDPGSWTAVGDWQDQVGGSIWDNANPNTLMTPLGGGIYQFSATLAPGEHYGKVVFTGTWDAIGLDNRSIDAWNFWFVTDAINDTATFTVDAFAGTASVVVPEPTTFALAGLGLAALITLRRRA